MSDQQTITIAICGKGGVGKTAVSALLAKAMINSDIKPLLLIDADPAGGLVSAVGEKVDKTLTDARAKIVNSARDANDNVSRENLSNQIDYMAMEALVERKHYSLMAMGRNMEKGCFCPANTLLRNAINVISDQYKLTLIDAEAGLEQISRQVTKKVSYYIVVVDGSERSLTTLEIIRQMVGIDNVWIINNRANGNSTGMEQNILGNVFEDNELRAYDQQGLSLWNLPDDNGALVACNKIVQKISSKWF